MKNQKITLEISSVCLLTGNGADDITLEVPAEDIINAVTQEHLQEGTVGTDIWGSTLSFRLKMTKGCGKKLIEALGLKVTKEINL